MPVSRERFDLSHSLLSNKYPKGVALDNIMAKHPTPGIDLDRLGFFEVSAPDFNKYYPDLKPEDLEPKDEDYILPVFRALSKTRLNKWGPINFGKGNVLKNSMPKLIGQAVYTNHEMIVGNEVGVISEASWQNGFTQNNVAVPAGINTRLKLDGKANPKLCRSIMQDPPSVHSVSVTVEFKWEQSHPELEIGEFYNKMGSYDAEGELIERVVTEILAYHEISLVPHGADTFAQKINEEGGINNPEYAEQNQRYKLSADGFRTYSNHLDWKEYKTESASFGAIPTELNNHDRNTNQNSNPKSDPMNAALLTFLREKFGLAKDAPEAEVMAKLMTDLPGLLTLKSELETTQQSLTALKAKYPEGAEILSAENKSKLASLDALAKTTREEAIKFYNLTTEKPEESITKMISEAPYDLAVVLRAQYQKLAEDRTPLSCTDCGSKNIARASSKDTPAPATPTSTTEKNAKGKEETVETPLAKPLSNTEVMRSLAANSGKMTAGIHEDK